MERFPAFIEIDKLFGRHYRHVSPQVLLDMMSFLNENDTPETRRHVENDLAHLATYANGNDDHH